MDKEKPAGVSPISGVAPPRSGQWKPGQSGNPEGGRLSKRYQLGIQLALAKLSPTGDAFETEGRLHAAQIAKAEQGATDSYREIMDRLYGKVPQGHGQDDELGPVQLTVTWKREE